MQSLYPSTHLVCMAGAYLIYQFPDFISNEFFYITLTCTIIAVLLLLGVIYILFLIFLFQSNIGGEGCETIQARSANQTVRVAKETGLMKKKYDRQGLLQVEFSILEIQGTYQWYALAFSINYTCFSFKISYQTVKYNRRFKYCTLHYTDKLIARL